VLLGVGPGLPVAATTYHGRYFTDAHNAWLNVAGQAGLLGVVALVGVVATICVQAWKARPIADITEPVRASWCAFVGAVLFGSLSLSLEQSRHVWVLLGLLAAGLSAVRRNHDVHVGEP
jgi:O-antigen ligase